MKSRPEIEASRQQLIGELRAQCRANAPGVALPPVRELAQQFALSRSLVGEVVQSLAAEGILHARQGAGIFVIRPPQGKCGVFLLVGPANLSENTKQLLPMKLGFEERVTQLGGTSLTLAYEQVQHFLAHSAGLNIEGIFNFVDESEWPDHYEAVPSPIPQVTSGQLDEWNAQNSYSRHCDWITFDHEDGGYQATRHLLELGHQHIAFLGLRSPFEPKSVFAWSRERQQGWKRALGEKGYRAENLAFNPREGRLLTIADQVEAARQIAEEMIPLVCQGQISALVAVNCHAARGFFEACSAAGVSHEQWPAVICFGAAESTGDALSVMTEMRMPWEELGREAANLLWSRRSYAGEPRQVLVPLRLVSRLSCKANWPIFPQSVTLSFQHI